MRSDREAAVAGQIQDTEAATPQLPPDYERNPYPFFAEMRRGRFGT